MQRSSDLFSRYTIIIAGFTIIMTSCVIICSKHVLFDGFPTKISAKRRGYILSSSWPFLNTSHVHCHHTATTWAIKCRWGDVTFPPTFFSEYRNMLVIGRFTKRCLLSVLWLAGAFVPHMWPHLGRSIVGYVTCTISTACFQCVVGDRALRMSVFTRSTIIYKMKWIGL